MQHNQLQQPCNTSNKEEDIGCGVEDIKETPQTVAFIGTKRAIIVVVLPFVFVCFVTRFVPAENSALFGFVFRELKQIANTNTNRI